MPEILSILLLLTLLVREWMNARERSNLLDRIMSKDYSQYVESKDLPEDNEILDEYDKTIPILEAEEEFIRG